MKQQRGSDLTIQEWLERVLYLIGAMLIRRACRLRRKSLRWLRQTRWHLRLKADDLRQERILQKRQRQVGAQKNALELFEEQRHLAWEGQGSQEELRSAFWRAVCYVGNYLLPLAGMALLLMTANYFSSLHYAIRLELNGEYVGSIYQEQELLTAQKEIQHRLIFPDMDPELLGQPQYTFEVVQEDQYTPQRVLVNNLIQASGQQIAQGAGLYVDGEFLGAVQDGDQVLTLLSERKEQMRQQYPDARIEFVQDIVLETGLYPQDSMVSEDFLAAKLDEQSSGTRIYQVQEGDSPYEIARELGISLAALYHMNPQAQTSLFPGDELLIEQAHVVLEQRAIETVVRQEEIPYTVKEELDSSRDSSYQKVLQEGSNGLEEITAEVVYLNGSKVSETEISRDIIQEPVEKRVVRGSLVRTAEESSSLPANYQLRSASERNAAGFIWPVDGGSISCDINGYWGHTGNDIQANAGTAIWASKSGTVAYAGWSRGYGYNVLIDHGDGYKTRYAHCSALLCSTGQTVEQGQQIALVGRTGNATCNHCHFEIIQNSQFLDSRDFVGSR